MSSEMTTMPDMFPQNLLAKLADVGFSQNQARVYLANLRLGPASIWDIAKVSGVKRTTCYVVMEELVGKGRASRANDGRRAIYSVVGPEALYNMLERRKEAMRSAMSELYALASRSPAKPRVRMFEGAEGMMQAYDSTLNIPESGEILIYGNPEVYVNYPEFVKDYVARRVAKRIRVRSIVPDTPLAYKVTRNDAAIFRENRVLPKNQFDQKTEVNILPDRILYLAHSETKPFATVVESAALAREEKSRFELLWQISKKQTL